MFVSREGGGGGGGVEESVPYDVNSVKALSY